jgi:maltose alpha-D-glucosyltransferase/alpha-amylase
MKLNLGIRRRLFPLLDNDRRVAELFHALLFSLPGSPIMYYGDEIGMGDNIYLGDRDGVRTPMQWTPDRNGGFSRADFAQLYLPPILDPVYGFQSVNVESQLRNPSSFLQWVHRMLEVRKQHPVMGTGSFQVLDHRRRRRARQRAVRLQPLAVRPAGRALPRPVPGVDAARAAGPGALPPDR